MLFKLRTPTLKSPRVIAGFNSSQLRLVLNKKFEPKTLTIPKKIKTNKSPNPKYPYANFPTVYFIAAKIARLPKPIKRKKYFEKAPKAKVTKHSVKIIETKDNIVIAFFIDGLEIKPD
jgi:hypothetical protein